MKYLFLVLLAIASIFHLKDSWKDDAKKRAISKPFLLIFILLYYLFAVNFQPSMLLVWALITSWIGDVLLIFKGNTWFTLGGISFGCSHILFILVYATQIDFAAVLNWKLAPVALVYYCIAGFIIYKLTATTPKKMIVPMYLYLLANATMNIFSLMQLITTKPCAATIVAYIGAILFFISDCTLFLVRYYKKPEIVPKKHFTVMLTYILGEFLITQGIIMLNFV